MRAIALYCKAGEIKLGGRERVFEVGGRSTEVRRLAQSLLLALMVLEDLSLSREIPWNRRDASSSTRRRIA